MLYSGTGGIDINRGVIVGLGAGGYLAALGGASLSPPPLAVILGYPMLEIAKEAADGPGYFVPANTPGHLRPLMDPTQVGNEAAAKVFDGRIKTVRESKCLPLNVPLLIHVVLLRSLSKYHRIVHEDADTVFLVIRRHGIHG